MRSTQEPSIHTGWRGETLSSAFGATTSGRTKMPKSSSGRHHSVPFRVLPSSFSTRLQRWRCQTAKEVPTTSTCAQHRMGEGAGLVADRAHARVGGPFVPLAQLAHFSTWASSTPIDERQQALDNFMYAASMHRVMDMSFWLVATEQEMT